MSTATQVKPGRLFIGGEWQDAASGKNFDVMNPALGEALTQCAEADAADVDRAVSAAREAFDNPESAWSKMMPRHREKLLWKLGDQIKKRMDDFIQMETLNNGKPLFEAKIDMITVIDLFQYYAGWATKVHGEVLPVSTGPFLNYTRREPLGVVGAIVPWNFPLLMATWHVAPALATGNAVILKPAEQTPMTALLLAEVCEEVGMPPGAINVVTGFGPTAGAALVQHPGVDKISFTGSTEVGKIVARTAADTVKRVSLELGGKSPNIIFADADMKSALRGAVNGIFYGKGEVCAAGSRLFVEKSIHQEVVDFMVAQAGKRPPGDPQHEKTRLGPLVSEDQQRRVLSYIEKGKAEGAKLLAGGGKAEVNGSGYYVEATVFDGVTPEMTIAREEIFGPVISIMTFEDEEEVIGLANASEFGLAAGVWTNNIKKAHRVAHRLQAGTVWINTYNRYDPSSPFGGTKQSGHGRLLGAEGIDAYTQSKTVWVDLS